MKILSSHKSAFERQIREAVLIDKYSGPYLMNSKVEYNRCSIPRIQMTFGNKTIVEDDALAIKEKEIIETIKNMAKSDKKRLSSRVNEPNSSKHKKTKVDEEDIDDVTENAANDTPVLVEAKNDVMKHEKPIVNPTDVNVDETVETFVENTIAVENEVTIHTSINLNGHLNITKSGCSNNLSNHIDTDKAGQVQLESV